MHRAGGKALAEHVVDTALALTNPESIYVVVGHQADAVQAQLASRGVRFVRQTEQKGTGHAVLSCEPSVELKSGRVMVLYGDTPLLKLSTLQKLLALHEESGVAATAITTVVDNPTGYGRIVRDSSGAVQAVVEEKAATEEIRKIREINAGIYCFEAPLLWKHLHDIQPNNPAREYYLTDMVEILNGAGHRVLPFTIEDSSAVARYQYAAGTGRGRSRAAGAQGSGIDGCRGDDREAGDGDD